MAPIKDAVGPSQEALLKLEKSTENNDVQLAAAAQILKLDLSDSTISSLATQDTHETEITRPAPKEEWVLRWLLKRFKVATYRVQPLSFVLLRKLLRRVSRRAIAATFVEYKFAQLLKDIVDDLDNAVFKSLRDGTGRSPSGSETSETVEGSPVRSKKRKRGNDGDEDIEMHDACHTDPQTDTAIAAYIQFLDALHLLMSLVNGHSDHGNVSQFHLQQSLRLEPVCAAQILGKLLRFSAALMVRFTTERQTGQLAQLLKTTTACFSIWDLKKSSTNGAEKESINTAFAKSCLIEMLRLFRIVAATGVVSDDVGVISHSIERLVALHVVLPARSTFMKRGGSGIDYSKDEDPDWSAVQPVTSNFQPFFEDRSGVDIECNGLHIDNAKKDPCAFAATWKPAELIPTFYNIVARSVPRDSFRRQNTEASWLETVFVALAEMAYSITRQSSGNVSDFIPLLEQLFIVVRARKIHLSMHTFLTHASYTGLLRGKENPDEVRWSLTALLVDLGVDIFLPNSGLKDSDRLLDALFQSLEHIRSDSADQETYQTVKEKVVIPLLRAFAAARDLATFVGFWHEQLRRIEIARGSGAKIPPGAYSVWEDDDLSSAYREATKTTLSDTHLKAQIETAIHTIITSSGLVSHSPDSYACFVILEAGSNTWGHNGLPGLRIDLVTSLVEAVNKSISSRAEKVHWCWRLWRLIRNLIPLSLKTSLNTPNELAQNFERTALEVMNTENLLERGTDSNAWREALEACLFLLQITKDLYHEDPSGLKDTLSNLLHNICLLLESLLQGEQSNWNGRIQGLETLSQLGIAYTECILEFPHLWSPLTFENLQLFVDRLSALAQRSASQQNPSLNRVSFERLWSIFTSYDYLIENPSLSTGIAQAICALLLKDKNKKDRRRFLLRFLPGIPVRLNEVPGFKEMMKAVMMQNGCPTECVHYVIALVNEWRQESQDVEPEVMEWITSGTIALQGTAADMRTIESFRSLIHVVIECAYKACNDPAGVQKLLKRIYKLATSRLPAAATELEADPASHEYPSSLTPVFVGTSLRFVWKHSEELADPKVSKDIKRQRDKVLKLVQSRLHRCNKMLQQGSVDDTRVAVSLATTHQILDVFDDLVSQEDADIQEVLAAVRRDISSDLSVCLQKITRRQRIARSAASADLDLNDSKLLEGVDFHRLQASEQQYFVHEATEKLKSMNNDERISTIHQLKISGFEGPPGASRLLLAGLAVSVLDEIAEKDSTEARTVSSLCTAVTGVLQNSREAEQFSLAAECLDIILRLHPRGVTQFNIDNCLAAVSTTMSRLFFSVAEEARAIAPELASTVYTRLCRLLGTIVGLYRQQLGGRFHVLLPALQFLLKALFSPIQKRHNKHEHRTRGILQQSLGVPHAVLFTRLLTSLCDPTASAVSRPSRSGHGHGHGHGHDGLIDQTKKAKVIAGQHLRILIESYAQNMLEAPLQPNIKTALAPGLYAVLDAMPAETKRGLNAGMDVSSRAIFKTLHEDYVRFGKWNSRG